MIKEIEIWDLESHEHTLIDGLSDHLNLLVGESNSGKTSIIRALKLVAYNEFDPKSVRIGANKCVVKVTTDKGVVKVTRGPKDNLWEVTKNGCKTLYFDKVGVNIVPDAAEVIGLNIVNLGDVQIPVNIMDQLESHFMLAGVGDKNASGSMRAQIVDEISGLSGIEGLVKDVGLDHYRFGREITETEKKMEDTRKQLHPEEDLDAEDKILHDAEEEMKVVKVLSEAAQKGELVFQECSSLSTTKEQVVQSLGGIPDIQSALKSIEESGVKIAKLSNADKLYDDLVVAKGRVESVSKSLDNIPDIADAVVFLKTFEDGSKILSVADGLLQQWGLANAALDTGKSRQKELDRIGLSDEEIRTADKALELSKRAGEFLSSLKIIQQKMVELENRLAEHNKDIVEAEKERDEILVSVTTCPLTLKPVGKECLEA